MVYGPPACGKGTMINRLTRYNQLFQNAFCVPMGEILREMARSDGDIARATGAGRLANNPSVCGIIASKMAQAYVDSPKSCIVLDGATRTREQVITAAALARGFGYEPVFVEFKLSADECRERAARQARESSRNDASQIEVRLATYREQREAVIRAANDHVRHFRSFKINGLAPELVEDKVVRWLYRELL